MLLTDYGILRAGGNPEGAPVKEAAEYYVMLLNFVGRGDRI